MSTIAERAPARAPRRAKASATTRKRLVRSGVLWIVALAALLAGVVALNVVVLQLNVRLDELGRQRAELKADAARLRSQISTAAANVRIEREARDRLGLVPADPTATRYVELKP
jgi:cell division protein FtsL